MSTAPVKTFFGIKPKLFLLVLANMAFVISVIFFNVETQSRQSAQTTLNNSLEQSKDILDSTLKSQFQSITETALSLSKDGRVRPFIYEQDSATLQDLTLEFERALDFTSMMVTDADGFILARSDRPEAIGYSLAGRSRLFDEPLQGRIASGYISSNGEILQMVSVPVFDNSAKDVVRGIISLSYVLSPTMANEINRSTRSEVGFYTFTHDEERQAKGIHNFYATDQNASAQLEKSLVHDDLWKRYITMKAIENNATFDINGEIFRAVTYPIERSEGENLGFIIIYRSETELLTPFIEIEKRILSIGAICLVFSLIISWILASRISSPIINLVKLTQDIENERYPQPSTKFRGDEVGILQSALEKMGRNIRDKNALESYLADIADNIDDDISSIASELPSEHTITGTESIADSDDLDKTVLMNDKPLKPVAVNHNSLQVGSLIDNRYLLLKMLGKGATGIAFMANDQALNEDIAIKFLFKEYVSSEFATAFKEEIRLARQITHRNILRTFDFGSTGENYYITMEYIAGYDLRKLIDLKGALNQNIALVMVKQICSALASAHEKGIIHRDLKPENMIINKHGVLKIMDFGLAMKVNSLEQTSIDDNANETQKTTIAGTPKYMAPEQFFAEELDQRTDIYAVGVILFTLLTGKTPFNSRDIEALAAQHASEPVPNLSNFIDNVDEQLEHIVRTAMAKKKEDRYPSITAMLDALNAIN